MNLVISTLIMDKYPGDFIKRINKKEDQKGKGQTERMK